MEKFNRVYLVSVLMVIVTLIASGSVFGLEILEEGYEAQTYFSIPEPDFGWLQGMEFDTYGNIYLCFRGTSPDVDDGLIYRIAPDMTSGVFATGFYRPQGIVWAGGTDYGEYLYVADAGIYISSDHYGDIKKVGLDGTTTVFSKPWNQPVSVGLDRIGNYNYSMYAGTSGLDHIDAISVSGATETFSDFPYNLGMGGPKSIVFDPGSRFNGDMYVGTYSSSNSTWSGVFALDSNGVPTRIAPSIAGAVKLEFDITGQYFDGDLFAFGSTILGGVRSIYRIGETGNATVFIENSLTSKILQFDIGFDGAMYVVERIEGNLVITRVVVAEPYAVAVAGIEDAIAEKRDALEIVEFAIDRELSVLEALDLLEQSDNLGDWGLSRGDVLKARARVLTALNHQENIKADLIKSIQKLEAALENLNAAPQEDE